jgi:hypothetical protein
VSETRRELSRIGQIGWTGVWDSADEVWLGTEEGPLTYPDTDVAEIAREMLALQLKISASRLVLQTYDGSGARIRDRMTTVMTSERALRHLEEGTRIP